ncbi:hypothetical protein HYU19_01230 [Candidatus Woesearchaeota archaeon]|nr:hypothetical protein [Candidatus Woesearchaeota archaeon]
MGKKKEKAKKIKKFPSKAKVEERVKSIMQLTPSEGAEEYKKENDGKIDHWRPVWRTDWHSISEQRRLEKRHNRPKKPKKRAF